VQLDEEGFIVGVSLTAATYDKDRELNSGSRGQMR
jgi:hypothetical protein